MRVRGGTRRQSQRGQTMALVAISMVSLLAMAALAIDVVTLYVARGQAERTADAAALAAAKVLADSGVTTDPGNVSTPSFWGAACIAAVTEATVVANQNLIAGQTPTVNVTFPAFGGSTCTGSSPAVFGIDPQVTVQVQVTSLPTFFASIWSKAATTVVGSATAEAFNPSNSTSLAGNTVPVVPLAIKPILVPNCDPNHTAGGGSTCSGTFNTFIDPTNGTITNPGANSSGGVIGESFTLQASCTALPPALCIPGNPGLVTTADGTSLGYYPLALPNTAGGLCSGTCSALSPGFEQDLGCVNMYRLACGQTAQLNTSDPNPNGGGGLAQTAGQCLIHEVTQFYTPNCSGPTLDQDCLDASVGPPFTIRAGASNPLKGNTSGPGGVSANDPISISDSVVNLPIYQPAGATTPPSGSPTVIGYLQAFIDDVDSNGKITVHVLNIAGCGSSATGSPALKVAGAGPAIPVRLIHN